MYPCGQNIKTESTSYHKAVFFFRTSQLITWLFNINQPGLMGIIATVDGFMNQPTLQVEFTYHLPRRWELLEKGQGSKRRTARKAKRFVIFSWRNTHTYIYNHIKHIKTSSTRLGMNGKGVFRSRPLLTVSWCTWCAAIPSPHRSCIVSARPLRRWTMLDRSLLVYFDFTLTWVHPQFSGVQPMLTCA